MTDYDPRLVDLYDIDNPDGPDHDFFRALADDRDVRSILDLGCGTGMLTVSLARAGRTVVGIDPSPTMLAFARRREGAERVEWIEGDSTASPRNSFDLALMTGNVAQHIPDADWHRTLRDLRASLRPGGILSFETRNPAAREWESWHAAPPTRRQTVHGPLVEWMEVEIIDGRQVPFDACTRFEETGETVIETQSLVFRGRAEVEGDLVAAGFEAESVAGDWAGTPFDGRTRLMIFVAWAH